MTPEVDDVEWPQYGRAAQDEGGLTHWLWFGGNSDDSSRGSRSRAASSHHCSLYQAMCGHAFRVTPLPAEVGPQDVDCLGCTYELALGDWRAP